MAGYSTGHETGKADGQSNQLSDTIRGSEIGQLDKSKFGGSEVS
jgi:hypothetical protein